MVLCFLCVCFCCGQKNVEEDFEILKLRDGIILVFVFTLDITLLYKLKMKFNE